jgi:hypothetical protein
MRRLDRSRDHAEIHDNGRVLLAQDGICFMPSGEEVTEDGRVASFYAEAHVETIEQPPEPVLTVSGEPAKVDSDDMRLAANRALKTQMEAFGEPWQGIAHARKFLGVAT